MRRLRWWWALALSWPLRRHLARTPTSPRADRHWAEIWAELEDEGP